MNRCFTKEDIWMANKHTKTRSSSLVSGEIQIKNTVGYNHSSIKIALKENSTSVGRWQNNSPDVKAYRKQYQP